MNAGPVLNAVCSVFPVTIEELVGPRRRRNEADARKCAAWLLYGQGMSNAQVAATLGGRNPSSVIYLRRQHQILMGNDANYERMATTAMTRLLTPPFTIENA